LTHHSTRRIDANAFRYAVKRQLGSNTLKSNLYTVEWRGDQLVFTGRALGPGVGLCQTGAEQMGLMGIGYEKILAHFSGRNKGSKRAARREFSPASTLSLAFHSAKSRGATEALEKSRRELGGRGDVMPARVQTRLRPDGLGGGEQRRREHSASTSALAETKGLLDSALHHELTHLVVRHPRTPQVPRWLEEGLVLYLTGEQAGAGMDTLSLGRSLEEAIVRPRSEPESLPQFWEGFDASITFPKSGLETWSYRPKNTNLAEGFSRNLGRFLGRFPGFVSQPQFSTRNLAVCLA